MNVLIMDTTATASSNSATGVSGSVKGRFIAQAIPAAGAYFQPQVPSPNPSNPKYMAPQPHFEPVAKQAHYSLMCLPSGQPYGHPNYSSTGPVHPDIPPNGQQYVHPYGQPYDSRYSPPVSPKEPPRNPSYASNSVSDTALQRAEPSNPTNYKNNSTRLPSIQFLLDSTAPPPTSLLPVNPPLLPPPAPTGASIAGALVAAVPTSPESSRSSIPASNVLNENYVYDPNPASINNRRSYSLSVETPSTYPYPKRASTNSIITNSNNSYIPPQQGTIVHVQYPTSAPQYSHPATALPSPYSTPSLQPSSCSNTSSISSSSSSNGPPNFSRPIDTPISTSFQAEQPNIAPDPNNCKDRQQVPHSFSGGVRRMVKPKRKRATIEQINRLNDVFQITFFPTSEQRMDLALELGMTPRTVQIWFQNKRQGWRSEHRRPVPRDHALPLETDFLTDPRSDEDYYD